MWKIQPLRSRVQEQRIGQRKRTQTNSKSRGARRNGRNRVSRYIYGISDITAVQLDDSQLVTLKLNSGNYLRFQPDTGAQCNVIPLHLNKKAIKDVSLKHVKTYQTAIVAYGGSRIPVIGQVQIHVSRGD